MRLFAASFVLCYLRFFAHIALFINRPYIIGTAGSVGKSSARNAIHAVIKDYFPTKFIFGNSEAGIPLGLLGIKPTTYSFWNWLQILFVCPFKICNLKGVQYLAVEMGIDDPYPPKNMEYLLTILRPDLAINLNVSATHTMQFGKLLLKKEEGRSDIDFLLEKIAEEDTKIIKNSGAKIGIYNADDKYLRQQFKDFKDRRLLTFGKAGNNDIYYKDYTVTLEGTQFSFGSKNGDLKLNFQDLILPQSHQEAFAASILALSTLGLASKQIKESLEKNYILPKGRASKFMGIKGSVITDSSYNSSKNTVISFLELLKALKKQSRRPIVVLLGDMRELGEAAKGEHEEVAKKLNEVADFVYLVGPLSKKYILPKLGVQTKKWFSNSIEAGKHIKEALPQRAILLAKGSQNEIFLEEAVKQLLLNKNDQKLLCRQSEGWLKKKKSFFKRFAPSEDPIFSQ